MIDIAQLDVNLPIGRGKPLQSQGKVGGRIVTWRGFRYVRALSGISLSIQNEDRVALIGRNGSGKSTFLRVCAGIYHPSAGRCDVRGEVSTLFSSTLGLYPDNTGRQNIMLGLQLLGVGRDERAEALDDIAQFSELGGYLDLPVAAYSAGMRTRLGFAIATQTRPDILLIDEVFGAGDAKFVEKAMARMYEMMKGARILVLASHSLPILEALCDKAIWLDQGELREYGAVADVVASYRRWLREG